MKSFRPSVFLLVAFVAASTGDSALSQTSAVSPRAETMWAAQTEPKAIRFVWNHQAGITTYVITCSIAGRMEMPVGRISAIGMSDKDVNGFPRRLSFTLTIGSIGAEHRCSLKWGTDLKGTLVGSAAFNVVTPVAATLTRPISASVTARPTGPGEVTVEWSEAPGATAYTIGRSVFPDGFKTYCDECPSRTTFVDKAAKAGVKHTYSVVALSPAGMGARAISNTVVPAGTTDEIVMNSDLGVDPMLKKVNSVTAELAGATTVRVSWMPAPGAAGYQVFRSVNGGPLQSIAKINASSSNEAINYPDNVSALIGPDQVKVTYAVKSLDTNGAGADAAPSNDVTLGSKLAMPTGTTSTLPTNLKAEATSNSSVTLTWIPASSDIPCTLSRSLAGGGYAMLPPIISGTSQFIDSGELLLGQKPRYRLSCEKLKGIITNVDFPSVQWAEPVPLTSPAASMFATAPASLRTEAMSADVVRLTWGPPMNAIACSIRRSLGGAPFTSLVSLTIGVWRYTDTTSGLMSTKPRYQIACGEGKTAVVSAFPNPILR